MPPKTPCRRLVQPPNCPYVAWRDSPEFKKPREAIASGLDRYGRQRYQCTIAGCGATFLEQHHVPQNKVSFAESMRDEARAAYLVRGEAGEVVAARLGVERQSVVRWSKTLPIPGVIPAEDGEGHEFSVEGAEAAVFERLRGLDIDVLRWVRRTGRLHDGPYVVGAIDDHRYDKAVFGELTYWLRAGEVAGSPQLVAWRDVVLDPFAPVARRRVVLGEMRQLLFKSNADLHRRPQRSDA